MSEKPRLFSPEFKLEVARRIAGGESVSALFHELGIKRSVLYRWRDAYLKEGAAGVSRPPGRPPGVPSRVRPCKPASSGGEQAAAQKTAALERKIGQQALEIDFLQRAFKRVKELRQQSGKAGATASTERSGE
jgi:transposase-like protein